jgi:hypothetical protein
MRTWMHRGLAPLLAPGRGTYGSVVSRFSALQKTDKNIEMAANASVFSGSVSEWCGRVSRQPGATTTLEPTFAFKRAVYTA